MTVRELRAILFDVENQDTPVFVYDIKTGTLHSPISIDLGITDRVDINIDGDLQYPQEKR